MKKLESKRINELFYSCFFKDDEIINGRPTSEFTSIQPINPEVNMTVSLSTKKLNKNKNDIIEYIDLLPEIENGNNLDNLYYDKSGNKWCDDTKTLEQLIMMALACQIISYTTLETGEEKIIMIKRIKEKDNLEVKGTSPEVIPENLDNPLSEGYTQAEKRLIAENKIRITEELNEHKKTINIGLGFLGVYSIINNGNINQIDFYDRDNNFLFSKKFEDTDGIVGLEAILNQRLKCEFQDKLGNTITYLVDGNRHIFSLNSPKDKHYGYRVEITKDNDKEDNTGMLIRTVDSNSDYVIKSIEIDNTDLKVELNNQFGPYGNYEDGEKRYLWYRNSLSSRDPLLFMVEDEWYNKGHHLDGDCSGVRVDKKTLIDRLTLEQFHILSTNIALHPRNKELISYTVEELEKQLPGIKDFIRNNFQLYNFIVDTKYQQDPTTEAIIQQTIYEKCNIKSKPKSIIKK